MNTQHTPGPWTVPGSPNLIGAVKADGTRFLTAQAHGPHQSEMIANARLIAAAPELLDALQEAVRWLDVLPIEYRRRAGSPTIKARDAIAKATGQPLNPQPSTINS